MFVWLSSSLLSRGRPSTYTTSPSQPVSLFVQSSNQTSTALLGAETNVKKRCVRSQSKILRPLYDGRSASDADRQTTDEGGGAGGSSQSVHDLTQSRWIPAEQCADVGNCERMSISRRVVVCPAQVRQSWWSGVGIDGREDRIVSRIPEAGRINSSYPDEIQPPIIPKATRSLRCRIYNWEG